MSVFMELRRLQDDVDSMFNDFFLTSYPSRNTRTRELLTAPSDTRVARQNADQTLGFAKFPPLSLRLDVVEKPDAFVVKADVPQGLKKEDVKVNLENDVLTISGERKEEKKEEKDHYHRSERYFGSFSRSFALPEGVDKDKISAHYDNGVLSLSLPKAPKPANKPSEIKIS